MAKIFSFQAKINAMNDLLDSGAESVTDPDGALMVTNAINSIIGGSISINTI